MSFNISSVSIHVSHNIQGSDEISELKQQLLKEKATLHRLKHRQSMLTSQGAELENRGIQLNGLKDRHSDATDAITVGIQNRSSLHDAAAQSIVGGGTMLVKVAEHSTLASMDHDAIDSILSQEQSFAHHLAAYSKAQFQSGVIGATLRDDSAQYAWQSLTSNAAELRSEAGIGEQMDEVRRLQNAEVLTNQQWIQARASNAHLIAAQGILGQCLQLLASQNLQAKDMPALQSAEMLN